MRLPLAAVALLAALAAPVPPRAAPRVRVQRINLDAFGWRPRPSPGTEEGGVPGPRLAVDSRGRILVGFTVPGPVRLVKRGHPGMRFRVLRFGNSEKPDLSLSVPADRWRGNGLYVDDHDDIIVHAGGVLLALASPPTKSGKASVWKHLANCGPYCWVVESASHRTFYIYDPKPYGPKSSDVNAPQKILLLNRDHPDDVRRCHVPSWMTVESSGFGGTRLTRSS